LLFLSFFSLVLYERRRLFCFLITKTEKQLRLLLKCNVSSFWIF
jgi:hypothetical protein